MEIKEILLKCKELGITRKAIADRSFTTPAMIGHYITGYRTPSEIATKNIKAGIKKLGEELKRFSNVGRRKT